MMIGDENKPVGTEQSPDPKNNEHVEGAHAPQAQVAGATTPEAPAFEERPRRRRGFAAMDRDRVREIASKGGKAAHSAGTAHQFSSDEARVAGRKGGMAPHVRRGGVRRRPTNEAAPVTTGQNESSNDGRQ